MGPARSRVTRPAAPDRTKLSTAVAPSTLNIFYALSLGLFSAVELRTFAAVGLMDRDAGAFAARALACATLFALLLLEMVEKRSLLKQEYLVRPLPSAAVPSFALTG